MEFDSSVGELLPLGAAGVFGAVGGPVAQETVPELPEEPGHLRPLPGLAVVRPLGGGAVPWDPRGGGNTRPGGGSDPGVGRESTEGIPNMLEEKLGLAESSVRLALTERC